MKKCTICLTPKPLSDFEKHPQTRDGHGSQCKLCDRQQAVRRRQDRKRRLIANLGGACVRCGFSGCPAAFDFHHPDDNKEARVSQLTNSSFTKAFIEAKKCILLCANCHRVEHYEDAGPLLGPRRKRDGCGTMKGYERCGPPKCALCVKRHKQYLSSKASADRIKKGIRVGRWHGR